MTVSRFLIGTVQTARVALKLATALEQNLQRYILPTNPIDRVFSIITPDGAELARVVVSADDISEARADYPGRTDDDIAQDIYEQRTESALQRVGHTLDSAKALGVTLAPR